MLGAGILNNSIKSKCLQSFKSIFDETIDVYIIDGVEGLKKCFHYSYQLRKINHNRSSRRKRGMASNPLFLHFPNELSYGYLRFEGNGKIPLGRQRKRSAQFSFDKLKQATGQTFFPNFPKEFAHFLQI